jgi:hypothetical protein
MSFSCLKSDNGLTTNWVATCASDDFKNIACTSTANAYLGVRISNDYGKTWYTTTSGLSANSGTSFFRGMCCSSDFSRITAVREGGGIWRSTDYGVTWTQVSTTNTGGATGWYSVCGNATMQTQIAVQTNGNIYVSADYGVTWTAKTSTARAWRFVCCDFNMTRAYAVHTGGNIHLSTNGGNNWTTLTSAGIRNWRSIACSDDSSKVVAVVQGGGGVWISTDSGNAWTQTSAPTTGYDYVAVSCSEDFNNIIVASYGSGTSSYIYSTNAGTTWTVYNVNENWHTCTVKNNRFVIAAGNAGNIYIGRFDYDNSLFKVKGGRSVQELISSVVIPNSNTGTIIEQPNSYSMPFYQYNLVNGPNTGYSNQTSTGVDKFMQLSRNNLNVRFWPTARDIPNVISQPITGVNFLNTPLTNASYLSGDLLQFQDITISLWIAPDTITIANRYVSIINIANSSNGASAIDIAIDGNSSKIVLLINGNTNLRGYVQDVTPRFDWTHVVCSYNSYTQQGKIYYNGTLASTFNHGVTLNAYNTILVGGEWGSNNANSTFLGYDGYVAYLNIFNREITASEAKYLYDYPDGNISNTKSSTALMKGLSTEYGYAINGGGLPYICGQTAFGATPYSKVNIPYKIATNTILDFAPYYTIYEGTTPSTGATHTLKPWTTRIFVIAIGGGGGGGGGNYQNNGGSGGGGGGGGGAGMAYAYCSVESNMAITFDVSGGGLGGKTTDLQSSGTIEYVGGNGLNGTTTSVYANGNIIVRGYFGNKAKNQYNNNTDTGSSVVNSTIENNRGGAPGAGGEGRPVPSKTKGGNPYSETNGGNGQIGTYNSIILSGTSSGYAGDYGEIDPELTSRPAHGGTSGSGGNSDGIQINGQEFIYNSADTKFINYMNTNVFCDGSTIRTKYGCGGEGGKGESRQATKTAGATGGPGAVLIFEYSS